jgi:polynucleotide 5'-hydroxyl-kinase GRC3/NOL9
MLGNSEEVRLRLLRHRRIVPGQLWEEVSERLSRGKGTVVIIGATDSGKSTLARYLIGRILRKGLKVSLVDSDVGQSSLGLPGTISMKTFRSPASLRTFRFEKMSFIGTANPAKMIPFIIEITAMMVKDCRKEADRVILDTSGLIGGELGMALQIGTIRAAGARDVVALQRGCELEDILKGIHSARVHRLSVPDMADRRTRTDRALYRRIKLSLYFEGEDLRSHFVGKDRAAFIYGGRPLNPGDRLFPEGVLLGLNRDHYTVALAVLDNITEEGIVYRAGRGIGRNINRIVMGNITFEDREAPQ